MFADARLLRWMVDAVNTAWTAIFTILRREYRVRYALASVEIFTAEPVQEPNGSNGSGNSFDRECEMRGLKTRMVVVWYSMLLWISLTPERIGS